MNWTIDTLEYNNDATKGVIVAHWRVSVVDGDYSASAYGSASFSPNPTSPSFKPYEQLTQSDVLSWVWGSVDKNDIESSLAKQLENQKTPAVVTGTPWV
jgi:hypothetical protein